MSKVYGFIFLLLVTQFLGASSVIKKGEFDLAKTPSLAFYKDQLEMVKVKIKKEESQNYQDGPDAYIVRMGDEFLKVVRAKDPILRDLEKRREALEVAIEAMEA